MAVSKRERLILFALALVAGLLITDRMALSPYFEWRTDMIVRRDAERRQLVDDRALLDRERRLRGMLVRMGGANATDTASVEGKVLNLVHDWEQQAGVGIGSFHRVRMVDSREFSTLSFQVSGSGSMLAVAKLLYAIETASIPLRVDDVQLTPKGESGEELTIQMLVSTLYRRNGQQTPGEPAALRVSAPPQLTSVRRTCRAAASSFGSIWSMTAAGPWSVAS